MSAKTTPKDKPAAPKKTASKTAPKSPAAKAPKAPPLPAAKVATKQAPKAPKVPPAPPLPVAKKTAPTAPPAAPKAPPAPKEPKAPKEPAAKLPKGMTAPEPVQKPDGPTRDNFGTLPDDKQANGIWYPRPGTKSREMWELIAKVQKSNKGVFPDRWLVMEAVAEANEKRDSADQFKLHSMSLR